MRITEKFFSLVFTLPAIVTSAGVSAQTAASGSPTTTETVTVSRIDGPVVLDGVPSESFWRGLEPLPLTMYVPQHRGELTEASEIRIAHDDRYLYLSGVFHDSDPSGIRVNSLYRDQSRGDDTFGLIIDPFDDNDIGLWFWTTPAGVRGDAEITADGQGGTNNSWNTYWDVATERTADGWSAEMRIPFSSLGFQAAGDLVDVAFTTYRYIARKNERQIFPDIAPEFDYRRPSLAHNTTLRGISTRRAVHVTPYARSGVGRTAEPVAVDGDYPIEEEFDGEVGFDVKYNITNNLTLDFTANTDFAQVEADDQQVNLTRFRLFFPEKRQFFQERSGIFNFRTGGSTRLFHSRRIGLRDGEAVRILGGARMVGRVGEWDVGVLDMQTAEHGGAPGENFGVVRVRRRVFNQHSNAGAMLTTRLGNDGAYNVAYGIDGSFRLFGDDYLTVNWAQSVDDDIVDQWGFRFFDAGLLRLTWNKARSRGFSYFFSGTYSGNDYQPDLGFVTRRNFSDVFYYLAYFHYPEGDGPLRRIDPFQLFGSFTFRNSDGSIESAFVEHDFDVQWRHGGGMGLDLELHHEDLRDPLFFPNNSMVPVGSYTFPRHEGDFSTAPGRLLRAGFGWGLARFYDGWRANVRMGPTWNVSPHLGLNLQYSLDVVRFPERDQGFDAHIVRLRSQAAVNTKFSVNGFVQVSNSSHFAAANVRVRYNFREGNDLWIVYNHGMNLDRDRVNPRLPRTDNQALVVKYTYTLSR